MPDDLPIYSDVPLRSALQFGELARLNVGDAQNRIPALEKAYRYLEKMEGAANIEAAASILDPPSREALTRAHGILFEGQSGAGQLRVSNLLPIYPGQDCAPPEFISRSLDNLFSWVDAESFGQIHPIERSALAMTRVLDIWPFESGNLTVAIVFGNHFLLGNGLTPFFVQPDHMKEFQGVVAKAMSIETQPLVNAIYRTVRREMEILATR